MYFENVFVQKVDEFKNKSIERAEASLQYLLNFVTVSFNKNIKVIFSFCEPHLVETAIGTTTE